jgi:GT2 family glycosyltransferase
LLVASAESIDIAISKDQSEAQNGIPFPMRTGPIDLSVVIPTSNRRPRLAATFQAIACQDVSDINFEGNAANNGSNDGTFEYPADITDRFPLPLVALTENQPGCGLGKNTSVSAAR